MPRQDGTGPNGNGPITGRGMGNCNKPVVNQPNQPNQPCGRGQGLKPCGRGFGRGQGQGQGRGRQGNFPVGRP